MNRALEGCHVLVVDDEPIIAMDLAEELEAAGALVIGPASSIESATVLLDTGHVRAAVLDIRLGEQLIFPLADVLAAQGIPFIFASGWDCASVPERHAEVPLCNKPCATHAIVDTLSEWWRRGSYAGSGPIRRRAS